MRNRVLLSVFAIFLILALVGCGVVPPLNQSPLASFTASPTSGVVPLEVLFNASVSYDPDGNIVSYQWDFKDGTTGNGETVNHTFSSIGSYKVKLTVTDNEGATDSTTKNVTVTEALNQSPTASFTADPTSGVAPLAVSFNASSSSDSDGSIINYQWDFKDGDTSTGETVNHTFNIDGIYNVTLTVTDNEEATNSANVTITVKETTSPPPVIHYFIASQSTINQGESTILSWQVINATSVSIDNGIGTFDLTSSTSVSPVSTTTYTLTASNGTGSTTTATLTVTVNPDTGGQPLVIQSYIISDFDGLDYGNIYELANGQIWKQTEYYIWYWYWFYPEVLIWYDAGAYRMKVEGIDHPVMVSRIY